MTLSRRTYLSVVGATAVIAGCSTDSSDIPSYDVPTVTAPDTVSSALVETSNFDGSVLDLTGRDEAEVAVGTEGNNGNNAYSPVAIQVETGTTVVWEWIRGSHNVVDTDDTFRSDIGTGLTFEHTFQETGTYTYYCSPHKRYGMMGAVVVE